MAKSKTAVKAPAPFRFPKAADFAQKVNLVKPEKVNKEVIVAVEATVANSEAIVVQLPVTKASKARVILAECYKDLNNVPQRKVIINRLVAEADLTKQGAATYLQNFKSKNGYTHQQKAA